MSAPDYADLVGGTWQEPRREPYGVDLRGSTMPLTLSIDPGTARLLEALRAPVPEPVRVKIKAAGHVDGLPRDAAPVRPPSLLLRRRLHRDVHGVRRGRPDGAADVPRQRVRECRRPPEGDAPMTNVVFIDPDDEGPVDPSRITRSADGRPRIRVECPNAAEHLIADELNPDGLPPGRVPGKRPGTTKQCPKCKGVGYKTLLYTRCTSFVCVLDDRSALEKWQKRIVLKGIAADVEVYEKVYSLTPETPDDELNLLAARAFEAGDGYEKARKGTDLHALSELVDSGEPFPRELWNADAEAFRPVTLQDRADMAAYVRLRDELGLVYLDRELFVVDDVHKIGGTFDGLTSEAYRTLIDGETGVVTVEPACPVNCGCPIIVDLKTGRTDYGQGKMAQQLAVYAHGSRYDPATGQRTPLDACPHVGIILALPQGSGEATWLLLDLERGWSAVDLSDQVREHRRQVARGEFVIGGAA